MAENKAWEYYYESNEHACFFLQWKIHEPHDYVVTRQQWRGGGEETLHCPGKTAETVLK